MPKEYIKPIDQGHAGSEWRAAFSPAIRGPISRSTLYDGSYHDVAVHPSESARYNFRRHCENSSRFARKARSGIMGR